jgi:hypothetical protein
LLARFAVATIGGEGKGRVTAPQQQLLAGAELPWQPEGEEEEGGWSRKSLIAMWWRATSQTLTTYQMYHIRIHPLHHSPLSPHLRNNFKRYLFSVYINRYIVFALYSPSYTLYPPPPSHWYHLLPRQDLFLPPVLQFCKRKEKEIFACLRQLHKISL